MPLDSSEKGTLLKAPPPVVLAPVRVGMAERFTCDL
jgi:hypothetical protein